MMFSPVVYIDIVIIDILKVMNNGDTMLDKMQMSLSNSIMRAKCKSDLKGSPRAINVAVATPTAQVSTKLNIHDFS